MLKRLEYKWIVAFVYVIGIFMSLLDLTITNVALPTLTRVFHTSTTTVAWVATSYLLSVAVCIPVSGWLGDRIGTKRAFTIALSVFILGSILCGAAWSVGSLIAFRIVQGVGGGLLTPVGAAMLFRVFPPEERARVSSLTTIPAVVAPALGPVIGGYLVQYQTWRWVFTINVPIGALGLIVAALYLREQRIAGTGRLDVPGFLLAAVGLATFIYALSQVGPHGIGDVRVLGFGIAGAVLLIAFVFVELATKRPMIDVRLYGDRLFAATNVVLFFVQGGFFGVTFLLPLFLQAERGMQPLAAGLTTFPTALGIILASPLVGRLYHHIGPRRLIMAGMALIAVAACTLRLDDLTTDQWWIRVQVLLMGFAFGFVFVPLQAAGYSRIGHAQTGQATAAYNTVRQIATSFGVALLATVLSSRFAHYGAVLGNPETRAGAVAAFHDTFLAAIIIDLLGLAAAFLISDRLASHTMRRAQPAPERAEPVPVAAISE